MDPVPEGVSVLTCFNCSLNLTGHRYILRDDKPFCIKCYEDLFANKCDDCKQAIGTDFKVACYLHAISCAVMRFHISDLLPSVLD